MAQVNDLNLQMFYALKVSETSRIPFLFMSLPGCGKSSSVYVWAEVNGYQVEILRGNSTSETEIMGYDVYSGDKNEDSAKHLIPDWAKRIFNNSKNGKKTLLFLDEITGCSPQVQSALLHLVFERKIHNLELPEDCLIVSAGNYQQSLGNEFGLLPPLMNRFCIFNLIPETSDLDVFLNKYQGASMGKSYDFVEDKRKSIKSMESKRKSLDPEIVLRVGEYFERAVKETTKMLITKKTVDLSVADCQGIFADTAEKDSSLKGFVTLRTLNYLRDVAVAAYICYGKAGIQSANFKKMVEGLCGLGLSREGGEVKATDITNNYQTSFIQILSEIDKLNNNKIKEYETFFNAIVTSKSESISPEEIISITNKLAEMRADSELTNISKPLSDEQVQSLSKIISATSKSIVGIGSVKLSTGKTVGDVLNEEIMTKMITKWNNVSKLYKNLKQIVKDPKNLYKKEIISVIDETEKTIKKDSMKITAFNNVVIQNNPSYKSLSLTLMLNFD